MPNDPVRKVMIWPRLSSLSLPSANSPSPHTVFPPGGNAVTTLGVVLGCPSSLRGSVFQSFVLLCVTKMRTFMTRRFCDVANYTPHDNVGFLRGAAVRCRCSQTKWAHCRLNERAVTTAATRLAERAEPGQAKPGSRAHRSVVEAAQGCANNNNNNNSLF